MSKIPIIKNHPRTDFDITFDSDLDYSFAGITPLDENNQPHGVAVLVYTEGDIPKGTVFQEHYYYHGDLFYKKYPEIGSGHAVLDGQHILLRYSPHLQPTTLDRLKLIAENVADYTVQSEPKELPYIAPSEIAAIILRMAGYELTKNEPAQPTDLKNFEPTL